MEEEILSSHLLTVLQSYAVNPGWTQAERKRQVMATHLELTSLFDNLPPQMRLPPSASQPAMPNIYVFQLVVSLALSPTTPTLPPHHGWLITHSPSIQYHTSMILLHRPFFPTFRQSATSSKILSGEGELHARVCRLSAEKICAYLRAFKAHYTLVWLPLPYASFTSPFCSRLPEPLSPANTRGLQSSCI